MADRYFISGGTGGWNNTNNWSTSSGGTSGSSIPGASDVAIFDNNSPSCTTDVAVNIQGISFTSGYANTLTQGAFTITVGASGWTQAGGTFTGSSSAITINGNFSLSGGTFTSTSGTLTHNGATWTSNTGTPTFNANGGKVFFNRKNDNTTAVTSGNIHFYNVDLAYSGNGKLDVTGDMYVDGTLQLLSASPNYICLGFTSGTIQLAGNLTMGTANWASYTTTPLQGGKIRMMGTGTQTISSSADGHFPPIEIDKATGTLVLSGTNYVQKWTWLNGTLDATGSTLVVYVPYNTSITVTPGTVSYNNVDISQSGAGAIVTVSGTWDINGNFYPYLRDQYGACKINTGIINVAGNLTVTYSGSVWGTSTCSIIMDGTGSINATSGIPCSSLTISTTGTVSLAANLSVGTLSVLNGMLDLSGYNLTVSGVFTVNDTLSRKGSETITTGTFTISPSTSTMRFTDTSVTATVNQYHSTFYNIKLLRGKTHNFTQNSTITINGQLSYEGSSGTLIMQSSLPGTSYNINARKHCVLNEVANIRDCNASLGVYLQAYGCTNLGNNTNVAFTYTPLLKVNR